MCRLFHVISCGGCGLKIQKRLPEQIRCDNKDCKTSTTHPEECGDCPRTWRPPKKWDENYKPPSGPSWVVVEDVEDESDESDGYGCEHGLDDNLWFRNKPKCRIIPQELDQCRIPQMSYQCWIPQMSYQEQEQERCRKCTINEAAAASKKLPPHADSQVSKDSDVPSITLEMVCWEKSTDDEKETMFSGFKKNLSIISRSRSNSSASTRPNGKATNDSANGATEADDEVEVNEGKSEGNGLLGFGFPGILRKGSKSSLNRSRSKSRSRLEAPEVPVNDEASPQSSNPPGGDAISVQKKATNDSANGATEAADEVEVNEGKSEGNRLLGFGFPGILRKGSKSSLNRNRSKSRSRLEAPEVPANDEASPQSSNPPGEEAISVQENDGSSSTDQGAKEESEGAAAEESKRGWRSRWGPRPSVQEGKMYHLEP